MINRRKEFNDLPRDADYAIPANRIGLATFNKVTLTLTLILALFVGLSLTLTSCGDKAPAAPATAGPVQVDAIVITADTFSFVSEAAGTVVAGEFVELRPEVSGRIVQLNIREGSHVTEGSLIAKINDEDLQAQKRKFQTQFDIAQKTVERFKKLLDANGLNQQEYDQALSQRDGLAADIDLVDAQIRKTEIRAPFSGLIGLRNVSPGAYVTSQSILATLQQVDVLKVDFTLPESEGDDVNTGDVVTVVGDHGKSSTAVVRAIEPQVNQGTRNIIFRAILESGHDSFQPGAFVNVKINHKPDYNAILIPTNCIIPDSRTKKVAVIRNGKTAFNVIETAERTATSARVTSGLQIGDTIAITGLLFLKPDAPVSIRSFENNQ